MGFSRRLQRVRAYDGQVQWTAAAIALCWATFVAVWIGAAIYYRRSGERRSRLPVRRIGFRFVGIAAVVIALTVRHFARTTFGPGAQVAGVAVCATGVAVAVWARLTLGQSWGMPMTVRSDTRLVESGPYRWVRHPIYSGLLLLMIGSTLTRGLVFLPALIGVAVYFLLSMRTEEADLRKSLPETYAAYANETKRLIPFIY